MKAVTVGLNDLEQGSVPFETLEDAFGETSLGILAVQDLPLKYTTLRSKLLSYSSYLAQLPADDLEALTNAAAHYEIGWSHGKEALQDGQFDTMKGSFYVDCQSFYVKNPKIPAAPGQPYTRGAGTNHWPPEELIPGFRETFEKLCTLMIDIGSLVARSVDLYAIKNIPEYQPGYLEQMIKTSHTPKARLLHYFPPTTTGASSPPSSTASAGPSDSEDDSWCATHLDDGCLTALTSAVYIDESSPLPTSNSPDFPALPTFQASPDPKAGLYIKSRCNQVVKVDIPANCLAFQTGEALQMITNGKFKAVPHFVKGPKVEGSVARNTLALFMQPNLDEVIDKERGTTYAEFVEMVVKKYH